MFHRVCISNPRILWLLQRNCVTSRNDTAVLQPNARRLGMSPLLYVTLLCRLQAKVRAGTSYYRLNERLWSVQWLSLALEYGLDTSMCSAGLASARCRSLAAWDHNEAVRSCAVLLVRSLWSGPSSRDRYMAGVLHRWFLGGRTRRHDGTDSPRCWFLRT